jgi:hypothetical protein
MNLQRFGIATAVLAVTAFTNVTFGANILAGNNPSFEQTEQPAPAGAPNFFWPTTSTWTRDRATVGESSLTPYSDPDAQQGSQSVILNQFTATGQEGFRMVAKPVLTVGEKYELTFWAKRYFDAVPNNDPANKGTVTAFVDARLRVNVWNVDSAETYIAQDYGSALFNPAIGGTEAAPTTGPWTKYTINVDPTVTPVGDPAGTANFFLKFRISDSVGGNVADVKYAIDNVSLDAVAAVPEPASLGLVVGAGLVALRRRRLA